MKYQYRVMSDLHLNHQSEYWIPPAFDNDKDETILILAGDCVDGAAHDNKFIAWLETVSSMFYAVVLVWGNHDYYRESLDTMHESMLYKTQHIPNLSILNNDYVEIGSTIIIGATLWTDFGDNPILMHDAEFIMNDYRYITTGYTHGRLTSERIRQEHQRSLGYIKHMFDEISGENGENTNIIVVTHHHPTLQTNIGSRYNNPAMINLYHSDLDWLIEKYHPKYWICGHTHESTSVQIGDTLVVANCRGYAHDLDSGFNDMLTLSI